MRLTDDMKLQSVTDVGNSVVCDWCGDDFTKSNEIGGFLFGSKAVCPHCCEKVEKQIYDFGEEKYIKAYCPPTMPFRKWVLQLRGGDNTIKIYSN